MVEHYEILYLLNGDKTDEEVKPMTEAIHQLLTQSGATITKHDFWGKRKLAYEIEHQRQGFYDYVEFDMEGTKLADMDRALTLHEYVLRHQIVTRIVLTPEQLAAREKLRERIAAKRQAEKEKAVAATVATGVTPPSAAPIESAEPISGAELEEKLEEILDTKQVDV